MVDVKLAALKIAELSLMKFFPTDDAARGALVRIICGMAHDNEQIDWLVERALALYNEWPGPMELRALFYTRWTPRDGVTAYSTVYKADINGGGFPDAPGDRALPAPAPRQLAEAPMSAESEAVIAALAANMPQMPSAKPFSRPTREQRDFDAKLKSVLTPPQDRPEQPKESA
jgi:hypothetical protein